MLSQTTSISQKNILKGNRIRLSMDMDLAVAKLNLAGVVKKKKIRSDEPTQRSKKD
jgi:hypothetical protein